MSKQPVIQTEECLNQTSQVEKLIQYSRHIKDIRNDIANICIPLITQLENKTISIQSKLSVHSLQVKFPSSSLHDSYYNCELIIYPVITYLNIHI